MDEKKNKNQYSLKEALEVWLEKSRLKQKFNETRLIESWETLMGRTVASYTEKLFIKNHVLYIKVNSAPLKNELHMSKSRIIERFNNEIGEDIILDIHIL